LNATINNMVKQNYEEGDFKLVYQNTPASIFYDPNDYKVVEIAVHHLAQDIESVTDIAPPVYTDSEKIKNHVVIVGTIGRNKLIDQFIKEGKLNTAGIAGQWETYALQVLEKPDKNIATALVIFGSDRRGTAYGVFELSKQIGVSPWYWWADVPIQKKKNLVIQKGFYSDGPPSVKYRGIFINDEDWGLKPWASKTFDPELGDIGPKTYRKVFELLLRLKANHCWPAMHECTKPFNYYPENKKVADEYAIVMGSAHCEPLLFNNATEWDSKTMGEWRYDTNKENIYKVLDKRVAENGQYENVYTIGMRGIHDQEMRGDLRLEERISLLEQIFDDQRKILTTHIDKKITEIPQVFIPYKEVLTLYNNGLKVPEDVTLMWVDDNYGYIRRLSDPLEQKRPGGAGVYYHLSYLGPPHEYLWLFSTSPALIWEEMKKAYEFNARQVWIANVGDIKPCEYGMSFFLDLAWDINMVNHTNVSSHLSNWLASIFGENYAEELTAIMKEFYALAFERKPEFMSFGEQFSFYDWSELWEDTEYSFVHYREAERRLERFQAISDQAVKLYKEMPEHLKPAYFQLVYYPVVAGNYMNRKILLAQKNRWYAKQGRNNTNELASQVKSYYDSIQVLTDQYNDLLDGKWKFMMSWQQHRTAVYYRMPPLDTIQVQEKAKMGLFVEGNEVDEGINYQLILPCFNPIYDEPHYFEIYNKGKQPFKWQATPKPEWIKLSKYSGEVATEERIWVRVDWAKVPEKERITGEIQIQGAGRKETIYVNGFNPKRDELKGLFVETNGYISIAAENYTRKVDSYGITWDVIDGLGLTGKSVTMFPVTAEPRYTSSPDAPRLEYDIYTFNSGVVEIHSFVLPVFAINSFRTAQYSISIDNERPQSIDINVPEYSAQWKENVRRNASKNITRHYIDKPGKHTVKIWLVDTGMAFDKIIIDLGGLNMSYLGPEETRVR
ncbi:MAG: glycosyl hydrolase 115 family protein, partial [candidate division KSB1 bacterium]|nr:glycosyl hydrolase 115 family protein [candidate division KSB1 bacterium]